MDRVGDLKEQRRERSQSDAEWLRPDKVKGCEAQTHWWVAG